MILVRELLLDPSAFDEALASDALAPPFDAQPASAAVAQTAAVPVMNCLRLIELFMITSLLPSSRA